MYRVAQVTDLAVRRFCLTQKLLVAACRFIACYCHVTLSGLTLVLKNAKACLSLRRQLVATAESARGREAGE